MSEEARLTYLRVILGITIALTGVAAYQIARQVLDVGVTFTARSFRWLLVLGLGALDVVWLVFLVMSWSWSRGRLLEAISTGQRFLSRLKKFLIPLMILLLGLFPWLVLGPGGEVLADLYPRLLVFWFSGLGVTAILGSLAPDRDWWLNLTLALLLGAFIYRLAAFLPDISAYPFSLGWSEASRYYYASLYFGEKIYGMAVPPSVLHPSRYLMQAFPFIFSEASLWFHRLWQVLLWVVLTLGSGVLLARRLSIPDKGRRWLFLAWTFLFLLQGPVYYHLLVPAAVVLWGFDRNRFWPSLLVVLIASAWAGISRLNWFPVPGMLAAALYFMERQKDNTHWWRYLLPPGIWVGLGFLVALGTQSLYVLWSGNDPQAFASSFSSDLLWYRLLPNTTYPLGVLTGTLLVSAPLLWLAGHRLRDARGSDWYYLRWLGLGLMASVLLVGGLVVSVKIGGGSNLHNLDAYLTFLLVVGSYLYFDRFAGGGDQGEQVKPVSLGITLGMVLIPALFAVSFGVPITQAKSEAVDLALAGVQKTINRAVEDGGEILFISERQLLIFDYLEGVTLVPEYEKVFLMEMVMSGNQIYLEDFRQDIIEQRFDLIITDPLFENYKDRGESWAEENNAWVRTITTPVMCYYWRKATFPEVAVQILAPRKNPKDCP